MKKAAAVRRRMRTGEFHAGIIVGNSCWLWVAKMDVFDKMDRSVGGVLTTKMFWLFS